MTRNIKFYSITETTGSNYSSSQTVIVKKKTLIINIPDIVSRPKFEESVVIAEKLQALHEQSFDIYFYGDGNFPSLKYQWMRYWE